MIDISRIASPSADSYGQYDLQDCWADRINTLGQIIGSCPNNGKPALEGLCEQHHQEIFGVRK